MMMKIGMINESLKQQCYVIDANNNNNYYYFNNNNNFYFNHYNNNNNNINDTC